MSIDRAKTTSTVLGNYLTRETLADQLGINVRTLDRWEAKRMGPPRTKIGKSVVYRIEAVRKWLLDQERSPIVRSRG